jgi:hypothetical protein
MSRRIGVVFVPENPTSQRRTWKRTRDQLDGPLILTAPVEEMLTILGAFRAESE